MGYKAWTHKETQWAKSLIQAGDINFGHGHAVYREMVISVGKVISAPREMAISVNEERSVSEMEPL